MFELETGKKKLTTQNEGGKMYKKIYLGLAVAAFFSVFMLISSGSCFAQGQAPAWVSAGDDMPKAFIEAEDGDKDGKVSKEEFGGHDTLFEAMDRNEDGFVELSEAPTAETLQEMMGGLGGQGGAPGGAPPEGGAPPGGQPGSAPPGN
jgi:hypothetical protein